jgi:hypothetical protein
MVGEMIRLRIALLLLVTAAGCAANRTSLGGGVTASAGGAGPGVAVAHERIAGRIGYGGGLITERRSFEADGATAADTEGRVGFSLFGRVYLVRPLTTRWLSGDRRAWRGRDCVPSDLVCVPRRREPYALGVGLRLDGLIATDDADLIPSATAELHARYSRGSPFFVSADLGYAVEPGRRGPVARVLVGVALYLDVGYPTPQLGGRRLPVGSP